MFGRKKREEFKAKAKAKEQAVLDEQKIEAEADSNDNKKIYLIAGAVAVLGAVIIIIKTRKK